MPHPLHTRVMMILSRIEPHVQIRFAIFAVPPSVPIGARTPLAWGWFVSPETRGKDAAQFVSAIATFAVKIV